MNLAERLTHFLKELRAKARQNAADAKEDGSKHAQGFSEAQRRAAKRLAALMRSQGICDCDMCLGAELRYRWDRKAR